MSRSLFAVILTEGQEKGGNLLKNAYPKVHKYTRNLVTTFSSLPTTHLQERLPKMRD